MGFRIELRTIPGTNNEISLPAGSTVGDLESHVRNFSGTVTRVNGKVASAATPLAEGDKVTSSKAAKGA